MAHKAVAAVLVVLGLEPLLLLLLALLIL